MLRVKIYSVDFECLKLEYKVECDEYWNLSTHFLPLSHSLNSDQGSEVSGSKTGLASGHHRNVDPSEAGCRGLRPESWTDLRPLTDKDLYESRPQDQFETEKGPSRLEWPDREAGTENRGDSFSLVF